MESLDERLERIEREADDMPQLGKLSDQALRLLLSQHMDELCNLGKSLASQPFGEIVGLAQSKHSVLGMLLRECEMRGQ
jgi:hypothetical protein